MAIGGTHKNVESTRAGPMRLIPEELQLRILSYISQRELALTVSLVCRHWHVLANDASLWRSLPWKLLFSSRQDKITLGT
jgi:hypothetical protein